jgi:site-specific recombinase XerD
MTKKKSEKLVVLSRDEHEMLDAVFAEELTASLGRLQEYAEQAWADNTVRAYNSDWEHFTSWCALHGRDPLPASIETVGLYLGVIAPEFSLATIERRLSSISAAHREHGHPNPATVAEGPLMRIWRGIVREKTRRQDKAEPLMAKDLRLIVQNLPRDPEKGALTIASLRDRAILLIGWAGALRRSELVGLTTDDAQFVAGDGLNIFIRKSKSDQEGRGLVKGIPYGDHVETCPVTALRTWLQAADIESGPLFRRFYRGGSIGKKALTAQYVSVILKEHAERVGLSADEYSAHSLRSGFITQAIRAGKPERRVKEHSGHSSWETFNGYVKQAATFEGNPVKGIGL